MEVNLLMARQNGAEKSFSLSSSVTVIGRRRDCDLRIPVATVSKRHCQLNQSDGTLTIRDLGSRNGTIVNGQAVKEEFIQAGDRIEIGPVRFIVQVDGKPEKAGPDKPAKIEEELEDAFNDVSIEEPEVEEDALIGASADTDVDESFEDDLDMPDDIDFDLLEES